MPATNLTVIASIGHVTSRDAVVSVPPFIQTTQKLSSPPTAEIVPPPKLISVNSLANFVFQPFTTSDGQNVVITNIGSDTVTISTITFSSANVTHIPSTGFPTSWPYSIPQGNNLTFGLRYYSTQSGIFNNSVTIFSDYDLGPYTFPTRQVVNREFNYDVIPSVVTAVIDNIGVSTSTTIRIEPTELSLLSGFKIDNLTATLAYSNGWDIIDTTIFDGKGYVTVKFDADSVDNQNGIYTALLELSSGGISENINLQATVAIDYSKFYNLAQWISPISPHNSVIGISYDVVNGEKTLTIGVGMGGDTTPEYDNGGDEYLDIRNLGIGTDNVDTPYPHWAEAYRFRNLGTGTAKTYLSGAKDADNVYLYQEKFTDNRNYGHYFGTERSYESMFIVQDDGQGNLTISMNNLRELSDDSRFNVTLDNLTRAFQYYSGIDSGGGRIINLIQYPISPIISPPAPAATTSTITPVGETRTTLFRGIRYLHKNVSKTATAVSGPGDTAISLNTIFGLVAGDIIRTIGTSTVEGNSLAISGISTLTNTVTLSRGLPDNITVTTGTTVTFKNPVYIDTSLIDMTGNQFNYLEDNY